MDIILQYLTNQDFFLVIWHFNLLYLSVPDEGYSGNSSLAVNLISTFHNDNTTSMQIKLGVREGVAEDIS